MMNVFDQPIIFDGEKENVVLIYSDYIIGGITREEANLTIDKIERGGFNVSEFVSLIKVKEIFEYEFEKDVDACIMFGYKNDDGKSYKSIDFKDAETAIKAESLIRDQFEKLGFERKEEQLTPISAAISPFVITLFVGIVGGLLTWFTYEMHDYEPERAKVVKWYVYLIYKISKIVGHMPFLILTGILVALCLLWVVRRMANPPFKISAVK